VEAKAMPIAMVAPGVRRNALNVLVSRTNAFRSFRTTNRYMHSTTVLCASAIDKSRGETLRFAGDLTFHSESVDSGSSQRIKQDDLSTFLKGEECRRLLLGAGGTRDVESLPASSELQGMWTKQVNMGFAKGLPETPEEFLRTDTVVRFAGLTLTNTVVNGFSIVDSTSEESDSLASECVSLLIGESRTTSGRKALVWLFNKLTGDGSQQLHEYSEPKASVVTHTSIIEKGDGTANIRIDVRFQVLIDFPKRLLRILPTSKEKMESQGSAAIQRAMSKDFEQAVEGVRAGFLEFQSSLPADVVKH